MKSQVRKGKVKVIKIYGKGIVRKGKYNGKEGKESKRKAREEKVK